MLLDKRELKTERHPPGDLRFHTGSRAFRGRRRGEDGEALEQLGYVLEALVCYLTALGLGTCWLGGSFSRGVAGGEAGKSELRAGHPPSFPGKSRTMEFHLKPRRERAEAEGLGGAVFRRRFRAYWAAGPRRVRAGAGNDADRASLANSPGGSSGRTKFHFTSAFPGIPACRLRHTEIDMGVAMFHFQADKRLGLDYGNTRGPITYGVPENTRSSSPGRRNRPSTDFPEDLPAVFYGRNACSGGLFAGRMPSAGDSDPAPLYLAVDGFRALLYFPGCCSLSIAWLRTMARPIETLALERNSPLDPRSRSSPSSFAYSMPGLPLLACAVILLATVHSPPSLVVLVLICPLAPYIILAKYYNNGCIQK